MVSHFRSSKIKWNKLDYRLSLFIANSWQPTPLRTYQAVLNDISVTGASTELKMQYEVGPQDYEEAREVFGTKMETVK